jgi:hypothetical protein
MHRAMWSRARVCVCVLRAAPACCCSLLDEGRREHEVVILFSPRAGKLFAAEDLPREQWRPKTLRLPRWSRRSTRRWRQRAPVPGLRAMGPCGLPSRQLPRAAVAQPFAPAARLLRPGSLPDAGCSYRARALSTRCGRRTPRSSTTSSSPTRSSGHR